MTVEDRVVRLEKRVSFVEKLLWLSAGGLISWLANHFLGRL